MAQRSVIGDPVASIQQRLTVGMSLICSSSSCRDCECSSFYKIACIALACTPLTSISIQSRHHRAVTNNDPALGVNIGDIGQPAGFQGAPSSLARQSPPVEDQDPSEELEMLHQLKIRPISHEQLEIEVRGIYAGLVMVEAKCIEIDETQSAAAQEKDPLRKTDLRDDQWRSLIALHKQVYPLGIIL